MMTFDQFLKWEAASKDTVDFKRVYAHMAGDALAGLMLSQIVFWHLPNKDGETKLRIEKDGNLWMAVPREDWFEAICVTARQADRLMGHLSETCQSDAGDTRPALVEVKVYKFNNTPTPHIRLLHDNFLAVLSLCLDGQSFIQKHKPRGKATLQISKDGDDNRLVKSTSQISKVASQISKVHFTNQANLITETTNIDSTETTGREVAASAAPPALPSEPVPAKPKRQPKPPTVKDKAEPSPQQALVGALSEVTGMDVRLNGTRLGKAATKLAQAGVTADEIRQHYGPEGWWYKHDWRGKKNEAPRPEHVTETWGQWTRAAPPGNGKPKPSAPPVETIWEMGKRLEREKEEKRRREWEAYHGKSLSG